MTPINDKSIYFILSKHPREKKKLANTCKGPNLSVSIYL